MDLTITIDKIDFVRHVELPQEANHIEQLADLSRDLITIDYIDPPPDVNDDHHLDTVKDEEDIEIHSHIRDKQLCLICQKTYANLIRHMNRAHPSLEPLECAICGRKFVTKAELRRHFQDDHQLNRYTCEICQKPNLTKYVINITITGLPNPFLF